MRITSKQLAYLESLSKQHCEAKIQPMLTRLGLDKPFPELTKVEASEVIAALNEAGLVFEEIDTEAICQGIDLRMLAGCYTTLSGGPDANEQFGPCPKCGGKDRFHVKKDGFFCRQCKPLSPGWHDAIEYAMWLKELDFQAACHWLANGNPPTSTGPASPPVTKPKAVLTPPAKKWQTRAQDFVRYAQEQLWSPSGQPGLDYLFNRGLTEATIRAASLGYNPTDIHDKSDRWGVADKDSIWLPGPGIVIPWQIDQELHRVNIRLLEPRKIRRKNGKEDEIKYIGPAGWAGANPLYNADALHATRIAILVEGEFCALTINQLAGDLVTAVATGSTDSSRAGRWIARLAGCSLVLVAFDAEPDKGDKAAKFWLQTLPNARRWRPLLKDVNDMLRAGFDVREWIEAGLSVSLKRWVDPVVTRTVEKCPPPSWERGLVLYRGTKPVKFHSLSELRMATL